jgi:hypothetical protein
MPISFLALTKYPTLKSNNIEVFSSSRMDREFTFKVVHNKKSSNKLDVVVGCCCLFVVEKV